jgi:hypothetical protein
MRDVRVPVTEKMAVEASVMPLCQNNKYTICAAQDDDARPSHRPFIKFHLRKNATSQTPTIKALYDTGAEVSLITPSDFEAIKRSGVVIWEIPGMTCRAQNASQQPMQTEGAWRVHLYLKGKPLSDAMIVTNDVAQSIVWMNIIGPRRLVMDPVTCTVDFRDEGAAAALGVLGQQEDGTITDGNGNGNISCAPLLQVNLSSLPRIARCYDLRALPEQRLWCFFSPAIRCLVVLAAFRHSVTLF